MIRVQGASRLRLTGVCFRMSLVQMHVLPGSYAMRGRAHMGNGVVPSFQVRRLLEGQESALLLTIQQGSADL